MRAPVNRLSWFTRAEHREHSDVARGAIVAGVGGYAIQNSIAGNADDARIASYRNAPERAGHCLTRMLPWPHHLVNRRRRNDGFPVRSLGLLSRPDLTQSELRRAAEGMGGAEPPAATRSAFLRASMARMASTGPSPKRAPWHPSRQSDDQAPSPH